MAALDPVKLQQVAEAVAYERLPNGNWKLDNSKAPALFNMIKPYVTKSATRSDMSDPENACQDIYEGILRGLIKHGPSYQGKPFAHFLKMKVNNVLTNGYNKRVSYKNCVNYTIKNDKKKIDVKSVSFEGVVEALTAAEENETFHVNAKSFYEVCKADPVDLISVQETLTEKQKITIKNLCKEDKKAMPHKLTVAEIAEYTKRLGSSDKLSLFIEVWSLVSGISVNNLKKNIINSIDSVNSKYNELRKTKDGTKLRVECIENEKEQKMDKEAAKYMEIGDGELKTYYFTPYDKKIQLVSKSQKKVRIRIIATEEEIEVPSSYKVRPIEPSNDPVENAVNNQEPPTKKEAMKETDKDDDMKVFEDIDEEDEDEEEEEVEESADEAEEEDTVEEDDSEEEDEEVDEEDEAVPEASPEQVPVDVPEEEEEDEEDEEEDNTEDDAEEEDKEEVEEDTEEVEEEEEVADEAEEEDEEESTEEEEEEEEKPTKKIKNKKTKKDKKEVKPVKKSGKGPGRPKNVTTEPAEKKTRKQRKTKEEKKANVQKRVKKEMDRKAKPKKTAPTDSRKGTQKEFVISLLKTGEQTRDSLANALRKKGLSDKTPEKLKNYVSVMLHQLKADDKKFEVVSRGVYRIKN